jgi:Na+/proline symporter
MIGASLSGVTFISVPGKVGDSLDQFSYMQMVLGYLAGYLFIAYVLMPIYYKLNVTSIYSYLGNRFGLAANKMGAIFFLVSRTLGSAIRLLLVAVVLDSFVFSAWGFPFEATVAISIALILVYTYKGGMKTIIWTDTLQTLFMLLSLVISIVFLWQKLDTGQTGIVDAIVSSPYSRIFFFDNFSTSPHHFLKEFIGGFFICIGMTGMDQDMMQKNLSCKNIKEAQKNMLSFSAVLVLVNFLFLCLGAILFMYAAKFAVEIPVSEAGKLRTDLLFPEIALKAGLPAILGLTFVIGLIAAAYSSADSAMTALTTSFCVDILDIEKKAEIKQLKIRKLVHLSVTFVNFLVILVLHKYLDLSAINKIIFFAGFTYGPLIGLFLFGLYSKYNPAGWSIILVSTLSPLLTWLIMNYTNNTGLYYIGAELILLNVVITVFGLFIFSMFTKNSAKTPEPIKAV